MSTNSTMANREVCDLIFLDYSTGKPFLNLDYANVTTTELTGETMFAYGGKGHPKKVAFNGERGGTLTIETQMQSVKLWQLITGGELSKTARFVKRVQKTASGTDTSTIALDEIPANGKINVYAASDDCGTELACSLSGKEITLETPVAANTPVIVYYMAEVTDKAERISVKSTSIPKAFTVYGDTVMKTENDEVLPYRLIAYKAAPQSTMSLSFTNSGDPGTITITCDLMADRDDNILDLILLEEEA